jgi:hypothetical protein
MLGIIGMITGLGCLICFIIVLIKQFQNAGVVHGIIGIITCGLWTLIWGWMNSGKLNLRNIMLIWTLLIIVTMILNVMGGGFHYSFGNMPTT